MPAKDHTRPPPQVFLAAARSVKWWWEDLARQFQAIEDDAKVSLQYSQRGGVGLGCGARPVAAAATAFTSDLVTLKFPSHGP